MEPMPLEVALGLCEEIREETRGKLLSWARLQCWGCMTFSKGEPAKMCLGGSPDGRGCNLVDARYARQGKRG